MILPCTAGSVFHMKTDYTKESNLIIPAQYIKDEHVIFNDGNTLAVSFHGHLLITSAPEGITGRLAEDPSFTTVLYPSSSNVNRYLLYKKRERTQWQERIPSPAEMEAFYSSFTPWNTDEEYLTSLRNSGEEFFAVWDDDTLVSAAYSTKGRRQFSSFFTRKEYRGKGYGSRLLEQTGNIYLFTDDQNLLRFYTERGFVIRQTYHFTDRRIKK